MPRFDEVAVAGFGDGSVRYSSLLEGQLADSILFQIDQPVVYASDFEISRQGHATNGIIAVGVSGLVSLAYSESGRIVHFRYQSSLSQISFCAVHSSALILQSGNSVFLVVFDQADGKLVCSEAKQLPDAEDSVCLSASPSAAAFLTLGGLVTLFANSWAPDGADLVGAGDFSQSVKSLRLLAGEETEARAKVEVVDSALEILNHALHSSVTPKCSLKIRTELAAAKYSIITVATKMEVPAKLYASPAAFCALSWSFFRAVDSY